MAGYLRFVEIHPWTDGNGSMSENIRQIIESMDRETVNKILFDIVQEDNKYENFIKSYVTGSDELYEIITGEMDCIRRKLNFFSDGDEHETYSDLLRILNTIKERVNTAEEKIELLYQFFQLDQVCCENINTDGVLEMAFTDTATQMLIEYSNDFKDKQKLEEIIADLIKNDDYGCRTEIAKSIDKILPQKKVNPVQKSNVAVYQLYAELKDFEPKIWRRFLIDSNNFILSLASMIITSFNGNGSHLYSFDVPAKNLDVQICIDPDANHMDDMFRIEKLKQKPRKHVDARGLEIIDCLDEIGSEITFNYDFGDDWEFTIKLEQIVDINDLNESLPYILDGAGLGILEDCGGVHALEEIQKIFKEKSGEQYESYSQWLGRKTLNLEKFNKDKINKTLEKNMCRMNRAYWSE